MDIAYIASQLNSIMNKAPKSDLSISQSHEKSLNELKSGELDFLIAAFQDTTIHLERASLMQSDYVALMNSKKSFANMNLQQYLVSEHVAFQFSNIQKSAADVELMRLGLKRKTTLWTASFHQALHFLLSSDRELILTLLRSFVENSEFIYQLKVFPVPFKIPPIELFLYWHKKSNIDPFLHWTKKILLNDLST